MTTHNHNRDARSGKLSYALIGWLIGLPLPIIILIFLFGGCVG